MNTQLWVNSALLSRGADGVQKSNVTSELGIHLHTLGAQRHRFGRLVLHALLDRLLFHPIPLPTSTTLCSHQSPTPPHLSPA